MTPSLAAFRMNSVARGPIGGGFAYTLEQVETKDRIRTQRIAWGEAVEGTARELLRQAEPTADTPQRNAASEWLARVLGSERLAVAEIKERAKAEGHAWRTVQRANQTLAVEAIKSKDGWLWSLPRAPSENTVARGALQENQ